jgi:hypothetical protein
MSQPQGHSAARRIMSMKNSSNTIENRCCNLLVCTSVPQMLHHSVPPISTVTGIFDGISDVHILAAATQLSLLQNIQTHSSTHPASNSMKTNAFSINGSKLARADSLTTHSCLEFQKSVESQKLRFVFLKTAKIHSLQSNCCFPKTHNSVYSLYSSGYVQVPAVACTEHGTDSSIQHIVCTATVQLQYSA